MVLAPNNETQRFEMLPTGMYDAHVKRFLP